MSSEGLPVNNVVGTSVDLGARSVQDAANSASSSQNADSAAASADAAWKFSRVAQGAAGESATAVSEAAAAAAAAAEAAQNATIAANIYPSVAAAQAAITAGTIPLNSMFNVAVPVGAVPPRFADQYQNVAGVATPTGVSYPSSESLNEVTKLINTQDSESVAFSFEDSLGRSCAIIYGDGRFLLPLTIQEEVKSAKSADGWVWTVRGDNGNILAGFNDRGEAVGFYTPPVEANTPVARNESLFITPNSFDGATQTDRIKAALDLIEFNGGGTLTLGIDTVTVPNTNTWLISESLLLPDYTTLYIDNAKLKLQNGVFDNIIRNKGIVVDPANPYSYALKLNENRGIKIKGSGITTAFIEGPDVPYVAPHPVTGGAPVAWVGDAYGWRTLGILLANTKDYEIFNFKMQKTTCWAISQEHGCDGMYLHDLDFNTTVKNGDGIDFRKGCSNGRVERITGVTADDTIAMTALLNFIDTYPFGTYIYPLQVGGDKPSPLGDNITNISISGVSSKSAHNQVRILPTGGSVIDTVSISNIEDTAATGGSQVLVSTSSSYGRPAFLTDMRNIVVNGIKSNFSQNPLTISGPLINARFNFIQQAKAGGNLYVQSSAFPYVNVSITNAKAV
ncbi:hypothetical protein ACMV5I_23430 [Serratia sp. T13T92]|uniref:hypothetical protein n=1 Tax=Serratia sp. T13T92 TaxID=3397496 RepID=UPI0039E05EB4